MFYRVSYENKAGRPNITNGARSPPELVKLPGLSSVTETSLDWNKMPFRFHCQAVSNCSHFLIVTHKPIYCSLVRIHFRKRYLICKYMKYVLPNFLHFSLKK